VRLRHRLSVLLLSGSVLFGPLGCVGTQTAQIISSRGALPASAEIERVPFYPQEQYYCGPASLAMALGWSGLSLMPDEVATQVYTPGREGTFAPDMIAAARRNGRLAVEVRQLDDLLAELAAGHPAIVFQNLRLSVFPQWHFAVAIGYDLNNRQLILRSGTTRRLVMPLDAFENTWRRADYWALVVLPPDAAPATSNPAPWLDAAAGLERTNRPQEAQLAYEAFLARWPENRAAQMGRANALFALNRFEGAEQAYREVVAADPMMAEAWNNLAYALDRQGKRDEAVLAAERAVMIGGARAADYADTLKDVSR
jgi:tetratricopeptide (TPR) repeat protein